MFRSKVKYKKISSDDGYIDAQVCGALMHELTKDLLIQKSADKSVEILKLIDRSKT